MARPEKVETWYGDAVETMARENCSLKKAIGILGLEITSEFIEAVERRKGFNRLLWAARHKYHRELGQDPAVTQDVLIGKLLVSAQHLEEEGLHDKAAEVVLKIAKIRGWVGPENQVSIFGELSQADLDKIRDTIAHDGKRLNKPTIQ